MIIAEIGINHNGDMQNVFQMIKEAKKAGADCVKFQKRNPDICVPEKQKNKLKLTPWGKITYLEYKKKIELSKQDYEMIDRHCKDLDIKWTASVWDHDSVDFMTQFDVPFIKVPSAIIGDIDLLEYIATKFENVVMSTGMHNEFEIEAAMDAIGESLTCLMHCTSTYPTSREDENLNFISELIQKYDIDVGYSGHEIGYEATKIAYALINTKYVERHFTLDTKMWGTDQKASLSPFEFKMMVDDLKRIDVMLGKYEKVISEDERAIRKKLSKF